MKKIFIILIALINVACSTSTNMQLNPINEKEARIYFIREYAEPTAWNIWIYMDGQKAASLSNNSYVAFSASLGEKLFLFDWPPLASSVKLDKKINLIESKSYYFVITGKSQVVGSSPSYNGVTFKVHESIQLLEIKEQEAKILLDKIIDA